MDSFSRGVMDFSFFTQCILFVLNIDKYLFVFAAEYGNTLYFILFLIVFCETGLIITPFLPGDSLVFAAGALAGAGYLQYSIIIVILLIAAILGDFVNYTIGSWIGPKIFNRNVRFFNKAYLLKAQVFYEKHGGKAVILARFIPIIRTIVPFIAGIAAMNQRQFLLYNIVGAIVWVGGLVSAGYFLGKIPLVKENFSLVVYGIILLSLLPLCFEGVQFVLGKKNK